MTLSTLVFASVTLALAYVNVSALAALALVIAGTAWILALSTLNSRYQSTLPGWAKARGMSYYLVIFQGAGALGSAAFGVLAQDAGLTEAFVVAAVGLAVVAWSACRSRSERSPPPSCCPPATGRTRSSPAPRSRAGQCS